MCSEVFFLVKIMNTKNIILQGLLFIAYIYISFALNSELVLAYIFKRLLTFLFPPLYSAGGIKSSHRFECFYPTLAPRKGHSGERKDETCPIWVWKKKSMRLDLQRVNNKEKKWYKIRLWGWGLGTCTFSQNSAKKIVRLSALWWPFGVVDFWALRYFPPLFVQSRKPGLAGSKYSLPELMSHAVC